MQTLMSIVAYISVVIGKVYDGEVARQFLEVEAYRICLQFI
jgi:hypothetical protein